MAHCIIIGAGPGGLYAGHLLKEAGHSYEILEASDRVGGRVVTHKKDGDIFEVGAQIFHSSYQHTDSLVRSLGLKNEKVPVNATAHYSMSNGKRWIQGSSPWMSGLGVRGNMALIRYILGQVVFHRRPPLHRIEEVLAEDTMDAETFFAREQGNDFGDYLVPLLCAAMNVSSPRETSVQHLQHIFRITAFTSVYTFRKGNQQIWQELAKGQSITFNKRVEGLVYENGRVCGVKIEGTGEIRHADHVILAVAPDVTSRLLAPEMTHRKAFFESLPANPQTIPVVYLDRRLDERIANYMGDIRDGRHYLFAVDCVNKASQLVPSGRSCLTLWDYHPKCEELQGASDELITETVLADLPYLIPGFSRDWVKEVELVRHTYSHPPYKAGSYKKIVKFQEQENGDDGLYFASDVFGGSYMECALIYAHKAVSRILNQQ